MAASAFCQLSSTCRTAFAAQHLRPSFSVAGRWPGTHYWILFKIQRAAQTVLGIYLKRTCLHVTNAPIALGVLNDYALYNSTRSLYILWIVMLCVLVRAAKRGGAGQECE